MMNPSAMTAAHRSLPFGTKVLVENLNNGKAVVVRINDRGPFIKGRIIDVSKAAASVLGMLGSGTARVKVSASGGSSLKVAAKEESPVKVATATTKMENASGDKSAIVEGAPVKSAKMEGAPASKPVKVAAKSSKPAKVASASRGKSTKTAKASSKTAKIVTASAGKRSGQERNARRRPDEVEPRYQARRLSCLLAQDLLPWFRAAVRVRRLRSLPGSSARAAAARPRASSSWPRPPTPMALSCAARASSTNDFKSHGRPTGPSISLTCANAGPEPGV